MARTRHKLSALQVKTLTRPGRHSDGGGLYLRFPGGDQVLVLHVDAQWPAPGNGAGIMSRC